MTRRTALVTGASRGIGRAIAFRLASGGFDLTVNSRSDGDLAELDAALRTAGAERVVTVAADLRQHDELPALVAAHGTEFGQMSALVLSGGVGTAGDVAGFPRHRAAHILDVNLVASLLLVQESLPLLRAGAAADPLRGSRIIGLASIAGVHPEPGLGVYGASKAALISLLAAVDAEESARGVMATALAPGYVATDMSAWKAEEINPADMIRAEDVAELAHTLLSLGRTTSIRTIVMSRSGSSGAEA